VTSLDLLRSARESESLGRYHEADRLRWLAESASPAPDPDDDREDPLGAAVREAEAAGDDPLALSLLASGGLSLAS
jgi:hypothetical protein